MNITRSKQDKLKLLIMAVALALATLASLASVVVMAGVLI